MSLFSFVSRPPPPPPATITLDRTNPRYQAVSELDIFKVRGKEYQRVSSIAARVSGKEERKARSFAYKVGEKLVRQSDGKEVTIAICRREQELFIINDTTPALTHLREEHGFDKAGNKVAVVREPSQAALPTVNTATTTYNYVEFKRLLVCWMVYCFIAFRMVENVYFRELLTFCNAGLGKPLPKASATIRLWIMAEYKKQKILVKNQLHDAISNIHLSFDLWTSPNSYYHQYIWLLHCE
ncbi:hypothetical protein LTR49_023780 [Elasticomyces elasticus]|nr:hypothetical protein LTR49_023780 [Elasticomyces elasticus]